MSCPIHATPSRKTSKSAFSDATFHLSLTRGRRWRFNERVMSLLYIEKAAFGPSAFERTQENAGRVSFWQVGIRRR